MAGEPHKEKGTAPDDSHSQPGRDEPGRGRKGGGEKGRCSKGEGRLGSAEGDEQVEREREKGKHCKGRERSWLHGKGRYCKGGEADEKGKEER